MEETQTEEKPEEVENKEIEIEEPKKEFETINKATALWTLQKNEISEEEYKEPLQTYFS